MRGPRRNQAVEQRRAARHLATVALSLWSSARQLARVVTGE
jgi:hypothetical protein